MMVIQVLKFPLQNEEPGGGSGGAPAGGAPAPETPPATGGAPSALAAGGVVPAPLHERIPEKYRVFGGEDGKAFDLEQSASKLADAYGHLEKRLGTGELPPESADKYEVNGENFGEGFDAKEFMADEKVQGFLKRMHAKGATNSQIQEVLEFGLKEWAPQLMQGNEALNTESCIKELQTNVWKDATEYKQNMAAANRAFTSLPPDMQASVDKELGNHPLFNQIMALFGREMAEDTSAKDTSSVGGLTESAVNTLMLSEAYKNPNHPDHERVSKQVSGWFAAKYPG